MAASAARVMVAMRRGNWEVPDRRRYYGVWAKGFGKYAPKFNRRSAALLRLWPARWAALRAFALE
jgi:hypothetical protein